MTHPRRTNPDPPASGAAVRKRAVEALGDREQSYWELVDLLPQTIFEMDLRGRLVFANRCAFSTFGYTLDDFLEGVFATDLVAPGDRARAARSIQAVLSGGPSGHEYVALRKDGTTFPVLIHSAPILHEGQPVGIRGLIIDLSGHKSAEERVRQSEQRYRSIFENSGNALMFVEEDSTIALCNQAFEELGECRREDVEGRLSWTDFVDDPEQLRLMLEYHRLRRIDPEGIPSMYEFRLRTRQGTLKQVAVSVSIPPGTRQSLVVLADVTARHRAETALRDSETLYRAVFENTGNATIIIEEDTTILLANSEWVRLSGYSRVELEGRMSWTSFVVPEDLERMKGYHRTRRERADGAPWAYEFRFIRRSGEVLDMINHVAVIPGTRRTIASLLDITARKHAEAERERLQERLAQAEKLEAIGQLAGGVAHDFNNQLNAIIGFAELLEMKLKDEDLRVFAKLIGQASLQAADLTQKLLGFARKGKVLSVPVDLNRVIEEVVALLRRSIDRRIEIHQHLTAGKATVLGDPSQLQNAFMNLALNARDAMPDGGRLSFTSELCELDADYCRLQPHEIEPGAFVQVAIEDTGTGMDAETRRRIFEPFFTTKAVGRGTGLGLASVYGAVKQHRGAIHVYSEAGKGSCFKVYLPLTDQTVRGEEAPREVRGAGPARILVVDDEDMITTWARSVLADSGFQVDTCRDGVEGVDFYSRHWQEIDLVILDLVMPNMGGKDAFTSMRVLNPGMKAIIASGFSVEGEAQGLLDAGAAGFLQKPIQRSELVAAINRVLWSREPE